MSPKQPQTATRRSIFERPGNANSYRPLSVVDWFEKRSENTSDRLYRNFRHHRARSVFQTRPRTIQHVPAKKKKAPQPFGHGAALLFGA
jgi:hypothetical protein